MAQEIAVHDGGTVQRRNDDLTTVQRLGNLLAASGYFSDVRDMAQAAVKVMAGQELGIPPVAAMMGIHIIKGKIALGGNLIASRIRAHGYDYRHEEFTNEKCVLVFWSKLGADGKREILGRSSFSMQDAQSAGLSGSETYKKFPRNMLFNRAISNGAKWFCAEVFAGSPVYVPEELGAKVDENGDVVQEEPRPAAIAESKIAQMRQGIPYGEADNTNQDPHPTKMAYADTLGLPANRDLPPQAKGQVVSGVAAPEVTSSAAVPEVQPTVPDEVSAMWAQMKGIPKVCAVFASLKQRMINTMGPAGESEYYRILVSHGKVEHANKLKQKAARTCVWKMWESLQLALELNTTDLPREAGEGE